MKIKTKKKNEAKFFWNCFIPLKGRIIYEIFHSEIPLDEFDMELKLSIMTSLIYEN